MDAVMRVKVFYLDREIARAEEEQIASSGHALSQRRMYVGAFPARLTMMVTCQIEFDAAEQDDRYQLRLELRDDADRVVAHFEQVGNPRSDLDARGRPVSLTFTQPIDDVLIPRSGEYAFHVIVDSTPLGWLPFTVRSALSA